MTHGRKGERRGALPPRFVSLTGFGPSALRVPAPGLISKSALTSQGCRGGGAGTWGPRQDAGVGVSRAGGGRSPELGAGVRSGAARGRGCWGRREWGGAGRGGADAAATLRPGSPHAQPRPAGPCRWGQSRVWGQPAASKSGCCSWGVGKQQGALLAMDNWRGLGPRKSSRPPRGTKLILFPFLSFVSLPTIRERHGETKSPKKPLQEKP